MTVAGKKPHALALALDDQAVAVVLDLVTMSFKDPMCVNDDGTELSPSQYAGANMNNFDSSGLYIKANLRSLILKTVLAPDAPRWFELLVKRIAYLSGIAPVERSHLE